MFKSIEKREAKLGIAGQELPDPRESAAAVFDPPSNDQFDGFNYADNDERDENSDDEESLNKEESPKTPTWSQPDRQDFQDGS